MYTDVGLRLATAEAVNLQNAGAATTVVPRGIIGEDSGALNLSPGGLTSALQNLDSVGDGERLMLNLNIDTTFNCDTFGATLEVQLVSMPILATNLTDATTEGWLTGITGVDLTIATDILSGGTGGGTLNAHGLPTGTPVFLDNLATTTAVADDTIYYVISTGAAQIQLATSKANALAGTAINLLTGNGTADLYFIPTIHATTGAQPLYDVGSPTNHSRFIAGEQVQIPLMPMTSLTGKQIASPVAGAVSQPFGAGPTEGVVGGTAQRYYYMRYIPSATIVAGALTADLVLTAGDPKTYAGSGFQVI